MREKAVGRKYWKEVDLLDGCQAAHDDLTNDLEQCRRKMCSTNNRSWASVKQQFLNSIVSHMAEYLLRAAPWCEGIACQFEELLSPGALCACLSFGRNGYEQLVWEAIDLATRKQLFISNLDVC